MIFYPGKTLFGTDVYAEITADGKIIPCPDQEAAQKQFCMPKCAGCGQRITEEIRVKCKKCGDLFCGFCYVRETNEKDICYPCLNN